jgi:hypothetical protein
MARWSGVGAPGVYVNLTLPAKTALVITTALRFGPPAGADKHRIVRPRVASRHASRYRDRTLSPRGLWERDGDRQPEFCVERRAAYRDGHSADVHHAGSAYLAR